MLQLFHYTQKYGILINPTFGFIKKKAIKFSAKNSVFLAKMRSTQLLYTLSHKVAYYPFGMVMPNRNNEGINYRFGYQGSETVIETNQKENYYTTYFRELDVNSVRWWTVDPKSSFSPQMSPYSSMSNSPLLLVDPLGDKEYKSKRDFAKQNEGKTWDNDRGAGDWLRADRLWGTDVWNMANEHNLQQEKGFVEYTTITQRTAFYKWFQEETEAQGSETKWAGAAAIVASRMAQLDSDITQQFVTPEIIKFANEGNEAIFNDVFPSLRQLYNKGKSGTPLKGDEAQLWDASTLYREQFIIIQPIYLKQSRETIMELSKMAKGEGDLYGLSYFTEETLKFKGDLLNPADRYNYGMNIVVPYYNRNKFRRPSEGILRLSGY